MPRHHKSRLRLGQDLKVVVDAFVWKRHVSTVRSVGVSTGDVCSEAARVSSKECGHING